MILRPVDVRLVAHTPPQLVFASSNGLRFRLSVLDEHVVRLQGDRGTMQDPRTWSIVGSAGDCPYEGRHRDDLSPFPCPPFEVKIIGQRVKVHTREIGITVRLTDFGLSYFDDKGKLFAADLPEVAYGFDEHGPVSHYLRASRADSYYGLGEVSGALNKRARRIRLRASDALAYDAEHGGPLYKHIPFYITLTESGIAYGLFYDNLHPTVFDLGCEVDGYSDTFRYWEASGGDLDLYFIYGPDMARVVTTFTHITGLPVMPPRWSLGYLGSCMNYTEGLDAADRVMLFARQCAEYDIPCEAFHLSSGYTLGPGGKRYVFTWNAERFPDPRAFSDSLRGLGIRLVANVKPALLTTHPRYDEVAAQGLFLFEQPEQAPVTARFWGGPASFLDFTNPDTVAWWKSQIETSLLEYGIVGIWNDNNEYHVRHGETFCHYDGNPHPLEGVEPVETLLMLRASLEACREFAAEARPFNLTRSGGPGTQRYAGTWSGDNVSDWTTLRFNIPMGLGLSLSGVSNTGHDVGGFFGTQPEPELWLRWVQAGIFWPRFCIHSSHMDGSANEPWMYPDLLPQVRSLIRLRLALIPYLYSLMWLSSQQGEPVMRPLVYEFQHDPRCRNESFTYLLGPMLLIAPVLEPGMRQRPTYFPGEGWFDWFTGEFIAGGQTVVLDAPLDRTLLFARAGAIVPVDEGGGRSIYLFPHRGNGESAFTMYEDDGETMGYTRGKYATIPVHMRTSSTVVEVNLGPGEGSYRMPFDRVTLVLPPGESRTLAASQLDKEEIDGQGRRRVTLEV